MSRTQAINNARVSTAILPAWPETDIRQPTLSIPVDCQCSWTVVTPGPGMACISRLKTLNRCCAHRHRPLAAIS